MYYIGIDLGGTNIAAGVVDGDHNILVKESVPTLADRAPGLIAADIATLCRTVASKAGLDIAGVAGIGIASPGIADNARGMVVYCNNINFRHFPMSAILAESLTIDAKLIHIANDANAAAWGEAVAGAAQGTSNSVMITLGTGVGGGIIIHNAIYAGFNNAGGELGHMAIVEGGRACTCGRNGCWEAYSSATAMIAMTKEKLDECDKSGRKTIMSDMVAADQRVSGKTAFAAMKKGDGAGAEVVDMYIRYLACGLTNIINIFQPQVLSLGGGVSNEGDALLKPLIPIIKKEQYGGGIVAETELRIAKLGNDAGIIGAAFLGAQ